MLYITYPYYKLSKSTSMENIYGNYSDHSSSAEKHETSSFSDEELLLLASARPKKRAGRKVFNETRHPVYRGVRKRNNNKWVCELREPNKKSRIWLGTYPTAEMAARAHDVAAMALRGKLACLNFSDSAWRLPVPASKEATEIRRAAAEAAEGFRPRGVEEGSWDGKAAAEEGKTTSDKEGYVDEEAIFDMPGLLVDMAEGLMLSPPPPFVGNDMESDAQLLSLWSYSI